MKYSEKDMAALIGEVEAQFAEHLNKAEKETEEVLTKSEKTEEAKEEVIEKTEEVFSYDEEDYTEMNKLYGSMEKAEAEAHYASVKKALFGEEETIEKSEKVEVSKEDLIAKSEFDAVKEENTALKKSISDLTSAIKGFNKSRAPKQKAITKMEYIKKSESESTDNEVDTSSLTKSEIAKKLSMQIRKGVNSEDKEKINTYYMDNTSVDTIKHLL